MASLLVILYITKPFADYRRCFQGTKSKDETKEGGCEVFGYSSDDGKNHSVPTVNVSSTYINNNDSYTDFNPRNL